ncbi:cation-translocating P-type ATPase [Breznakiella homolactica]|uniref:Cation-translocating P-type ATPase n=1 Tax=Breznakiella homolactica TaxID=2798577 RepID=A0A7T8B7Q1_9SPIR|nr:cation-translocating P-type ATPase [Breznakiella homolactica]QQO07759.1 cation-translocating P-type ATPase [Breznakiella homolactica]
MEDWYLTTINEISEKLSVNFGKGLSSDQVHEKQAQYGKNEFSRQKKESLIRKILRQFKDVSVLILLLAAILSLLLALRSGHGFIEPAVIISIVIMNVILAITQEGKAEKALEALADMNSPSCIVLRDGKKQQIHTTDVVPGDIVLLEPGVMVPADGRLLESTSLAVDESSLTGESEPAEKDAAAELSGGLPIGDQDNMVFMGCLVTAGRGKAVITATGMETQMGKIAGFLGETQPQKTPLQQRLDRMGKVISVIAILSAIVLFAVGLRQGMEIWNLVLLAVSLAVAAVPETLALIVTLTLANGVSNMVKKNALVRKLPAVETLGSVSVICTDKTGTLTQNKMTVKSLWVPGSPAFCDEEKLSERQMEFLRRLALASNARPETGDDGETVVLGNPTEAAVIRYALTKGMDLAPLEAQYPKAGEIPFSSDRKMMTAILKDPQGGYLILTKGALDRLPFKPQEQELRSEINEKHDSFAAGALRVIALGSRRVEELPPEDAWGELERDLTFEGIIGMIDPPRPEVAAAIETAKRAGIRTVMITGDHASTAAAIAREIGILSDGQKVITGAELAELSDDDLHCSVRDYSVYARVSPEDKIRIVKAWQSRHEIVAMTGDGVNDAPALKAADAGVAMGKAGTEVAKSAADIVLTDDNFATIVEAVHEGRNVYSNIRKTIYFLLVCNLSEVTGMLFAQIAGWGILVTPVMLLLVNVLGDGIPGLHLARETSDPRIMQNDPVDKGASFFAGGLMYVIIQQTIAVSAAMLTAFYLGSFVSIGSGFPPSHGIGQTMAFIVLGWTSFLHILTVRSRSSIFKRAILDNPPMLISVLAMTLVFALFVLIPPVRDLLGLTAIGPYHWLVILGLTLVPTAVAEFEKLLENHTNILAYRNKIVGWTAIWRKPAKETKNEAADICP